MKIRSGYQKGKNYLQVCLPQAGFKGVVSSYQIRLSLPSVAKTHPKTYPSQFNLQFCQTPVFRLGVDFVLPLSQEEQKEEQEE